MTPPMKEAAEHIHRMGHSARLDSFLDHFGRAGHRIWGYLHRDGYTCMEGERVMLTEKGRRALGFEFIQ